MRNALFVIGLLSLAGNTWADALPPSVDYVFPFGSDVPLNARILIHYPCCGSGQESIRLEAGGQLVAGRTEFAAGYWVVFTPAQPLAPATAYAISLQLSYHAAFSSTFTTGNSNDTSTPVISSTQPGNNQDVYSPNQPFEVRFSKPLNPLEAQKRLPVVTELSQSPSGYYSTWRMTDAYTLSWTHDPLQPNMVYRLSFPNGVPGDIFGNAAAPVAPILFTTYVSPPPKDPAKLTYSSPAASATAVPTNSAIILQFDKAFYTPADTAFVLGSDADPSVPLKMEAVANTNVIILRPQLLLRGNQNYRLQVSELYDRFGGVLANATLLEFRTATLPESTACRTVSGPTSLMPPVDRLQWRFSRPINPVLLPVLGLLSKIPRNGPTPTVPVRLLDDGVTLEVEIPGPGRYVLSGYLYDRVESKSAQNLYPTDVIVSTVSDTRRPSVLATFPADRATAVPALVRPAVLFDKDVQPFAAEQVQLLRGSQTVAVDVTLSNRVLTLAPKQALETGVDYRVLLLKPKDWAGNVGDDVDFDFHVDTFPSGAFQLLSVDPASGTQSVPSGTALSFTFNRAPNAVGIVNVYNSRITSSAGEVPGRWRFDDNRVVFEPEAGLPPGSRVTWDLGTVTDLSAQALSTGGSTYGYFWVDPVVSSSAAPKVIATYPEQGATAIAGSPTIVLQFDQALQPASLNSQSVIVSCREGIYASSLSSSYDAATKRVNINASSGSCSEVTVRLSSQVRSIQGVPAEPFSGTFQLSSTGSYGIPINPPPPALLRTTVPSGGNTLPLDSPIIVYFWEAISRDLVESALHLYAGDTEVAGRFEWIPDNTALTFFPASVWPPNTKIQLVLSNLPWNRPGAETQSWTTAYAQPDPKNIRTDSMAAAGGQVPTDAVFDVELTSDQEPDSIQSPVLITGPQGAEVRIPLKVTPRSSRVFRFTAPQPLKASTGYTLKFQAGTLGQVQTNVYTLSFATPTSRYIAAVPTEATGEVPVNGLIWFQSRTALNPLTFNPTVTVDGEPARFTTEISQNGFLVILRPVGLLKGNATYRVSYSGLEDAAGRAIPDRSWTFHTGSGPSFEATSMQSWNPKGIVSPKSPLHVRFNHPVYYLRNSRWADEYRAQDFAIRSSSATVIGDIDVSEDGRTLTWLPDRPWPANVPIGPSIDSYLFHDWVGTPITEVRGQGNNLVIPQFTASPSVTGPPRLEATNPLRDATGVPLNVRLGVRMTEAVLDSSLGQVRIEFDGQTVPSSVSPAADGHTINIAPTILLPNRRYRVVLDGVQNTDGVAQEETIAWEFVTGDRFETSRPSVIAYPVLSDPARIRFVMDRPLNPLTIDASKFSLWYQSAGSIAFDVAMEENARAIVLTPKVPFPTVGGNVQFGVSSILDWAGNEGNTGASFYSADLVAADTTPPVVEALIPVADSTVTWFSRVAVGFDETVYLRDGTAGISLTCDGQPLAISMGTSRPGRAISFSPVVGLLPGKSCWAEVAGVVDAMGNEAPALRWSFQVSPDLTAPSTSTKVVSWTPPANGAVGVPPDTPIEFEFSDFVLPGDSGSITASNTMYGYQAVPSRYDVDGRRLRIRPAAALPAGRTITVNGSVTNWLGYSISVYNSFATAASPDITPPALESVTPAPGTRLPAGLNYFIFRFSEPVAVTGNWVRLRMSGSDQYPQSTVIPIAGDGRTVVAAFTLNGNSSATLDLLPDVTDLAGNPLASVTLPYTSGPSAEAGSPRIVSMLPADQSTNVPVNAGIDLIFSRPMVEASLAAGIQVSNDGYLVAFTLTGSDEGRRWHLTPAAPWIPNSAVQVVVTRMVYATSGVQIDWDISGVFRTAASAGASAASGELAAIDATADLVEFRFAAPQTGLPTEPFGLRSGQQRVPARIERLDDVWVRLVPDERLVPGRSYHLMAGPGIEYPLRIPATAPDQDASGTWEARADEQGVIRVQLARKLRPAELAGGTLRVIDDNGVDVPHQARLSIDRKWLLIEALGGAKRYRVLIGGREIPVR